MTLYHHRHLRVFLLIQHLNEMKNYQQLKMLTQKNHHQIMWIKQQNKRIKHHI